MSKRWSKINPDTLVLLKQIFLGVFSIAIIFGLVLGVRYLTHLPSFNIKEIKVSGGETIDHDLLKKLSEQALVGEYLKLVPRSSVWFYPKEEIVESLSKVERIHNIGLSRDGDILQIEFDEYLPYALWCQTAEGENCFFMDRHGYAFAKAPKLSGGSFLRFVKSGDEPDVGKVFTENELLEELVELVSLLDVNGWQISTIELDQVNDAFLAVVGGGEFKISTRLEPEKTVDNLLTVLASDDFAHLTPGAFNYVDLRFGDKIYINDEMVQSEVGEVEAEE